VIEEKYNIYCKSEPFHPSLQLLSQLSGPNKFSQVSNVCDNLVLGELGGFSCITREISPRGLAYLLERAKPLL
jgi:hypothetical protein